jgi:hypothetical protein
LQAETGSECRLCQQLDETIDHTSACPVLAKEQCVKRHDTGIAQLHLNIRKEIEVKLDNENMSDHVQKLVETSRECKVQEPTDRPISDNRSYIIIGGNTKGAYIFVDVAIAGDRNEIKKLAEKILKYKQ